MLIYDTELIKSIASSQKSVATQRRVTRQTTYHTRNIARNTSDIGYWGRKRLSHPEDSALTFSHPMATWLKATFQAPQTVKINNSEIDDNKRRKKANSTQQEFSAGYV